MIIRHRGLMPQLPDHDQNLVVNSASVLIMFAGLSSPSNSSHSPAVRKPVKQPAIADSKSLLLLHVLMCMCMCVSSAAPAAAGPRFCHAGCAASLPAVLELPGGCAVRVVAAEELAGLVQLSPVAVWPPGALRPGAAGVFKGRQGGTSLL